MVERPGAKSARCRLASWARAICQPIWTFGRGGRGHTGWLATFLAQYPLPGTGTWSFLHVLANATSETPK